MRRVHTKLADESPAFIPRTSTGNWQGHIGGIIEGGRLRPPFLNSLLTSGGEISFVEFNLVMITSYSCKLNFFFKNKKKMQARNTLSRGNTDSQVLLSRWYALLSPELSTVKTTDKSIPPVAMETYPHVGHCSAICTGNITSGHSNTNSCNFLLK